MTQKQEASDHAADLLTINDAVNRIRKAGWQFPNPASDKDHKLLIIEPGSTGVHEGMCDGEEFGYWICDGEMWPSRPMLVKRIGKKEGAE